MELERRERGLLIEEMLERPFNGRVGCELSLYNWACESANTKNGWCRRIKTSLKMSCSIAICHAEERNVVLVSA